MKKAFFLFLYSTGLTRMVSWLNRKRVTILCYHGVTLRGERSPDDPFGLHVRLDRFIAQLDYLKQNHCVLSLSDYLEARRAGKPLPDYSVVLTFDDGYRNFFTLAAPHLLERGLPATVFLITGKMRDGEIPDRSWNPEDDRLYMSWEEASELDREPAIEIGSHTCSHARLSSLSTVEAAHELNDSRAAIVARVSEKAPALAYPYGDYSERVVEQARAAGYVCALTTDEGPNAPGHDLFTLRRTLIGDDDDVPAFAARVSGLLSWLGGARAVLRRLRPSQTRVVKEASPRQIEHTRS